MEGGGAAGEGGQAVPGGAEGTGLWRPPKVAKKAKKAVLFFEVEILDAKTREKLCFLDKVSGCGHLLPRGWGVEGA